MPSCCIDAVGETNDGIALVLTTGDHSPPVALGSRQRRL